jgi:putative Ca2+/H+ antiporter (TMEM165/GDT1 family)
MTKALRIFEEVGDRTQLAIIRSILAELDGTAPPG